VEDTKFEARNPKLQTNSKSQYLNSKHQLCIGFMILDLKFIWDFDIRISDFIVIVFSTFSSPSSKGCLKQFGLPLEEGPAAYQLVGRVRAYLGYDG